MSPDYGGLPVNLSHGLSKLANVGAAALVGVAAIGIVGSLIALLLASLAQNPMWSERAKVALMMSAGGPALLYLVVALSNALTGFFK